MIELKIVQRRVNFARPARTSRDTLHAREIVYLLIRNAETQVIGMGECAPLWGLSVETPQSLHESLQAISGIQSLEEIPEDLLHRNPSIRFAVETAMLDLQNGGSFELFPQLIRKPIPINGLVWMADKETMLAEAQNKIEQGFRCIKLKIGGIDFEDEKKILTRLRQDYPADQLEIRLDANGAFKPDNALNQLEILSQWDIHSIEQPIRQGQWTEMANLCRHSPIPIALDEELIDVNQNKEAMLDTIRPAYIILKPTLHGGMKGCDEWIRYAQERNIDWWATSALETNVGLNAIAQWVSTYPIHLPQGLGTGKLYVDNIHSPLMSGNGYFWWDKTISWENIKQQLWNS